MKRKFILTLLRIPKIGNIRARNIIRSSTNTINNLDDLQNTIATAQKKYNGIPSIEKKQLEKAYKEAVNILEKSEKSSIKTISFLEEGYPKIFLLLENNPLLIYTKGDIGLLKNKHSIAVIGTRNPSNFGERAGAKLTRYFVDAGFIIISGLALGSDSVAHKAAIKYGGITVAVLPSGLDKIYPAKNKELSEQIVENGGILLSEYPIGTTPRKNNFIDRDRLQSGLSQAICIIETSVKGGTMHTAKFAEKQQRLISVLKHPEEKRGINSKGNEMLLEEKKASPLGNKEDIFSFIKKVKKTPVYKTEKNSSPKVTKQMTLV